MHPTISAARTERTLTYTMKDCLPNASAAGLFFVAHEWMAVHGEDPFLLASAHHHLMTVVPKSIFIIRHVEVMMIGN